MVTRSNSAGSPRVIGARDGEVLKIVLIGFGRPLADSMPIPTGLTPFCRKSLVEFGDRDPAHSAVGLFSEIDPAVNITQGQTNLFCRESV